MDLKLPTNSSRIFHRIIPLFKNLTLVITGCTSRFTDLDRQRAAYFGCLRGERNSCVIYFSVNKLKQTYCLYLDLAVGCE